MFCKLILIVGILGSLAAAEGLNRFGSLVSAFEGADEPFYMVMSEPPGNSGLFRLGRCDWPEEGPAVELGWWHKGKMDFSHNPNKQAVWCGLYAD